MPSPTDRYSSLLAAWRTSSRVTSYLVQHLPSPLWNAVVPGAPRRTVRMLVAHLHNSRSSWIRTLGGEHGIPVPAMVDPRRASRRELTTALRRSSKGIEALLASGLAAGGRVPPSKAYVWRNLPLDVGHVLAYFVAHEAHHRGQLAMLARALGHRLPATVTAGLWQWTTRSHEAEAGRA